ncbi:SMP-30/gluconolactonase/LRE family protein [Paenibacillus sp. CAU 1782]
MVHSAELVLDVKSKLGEGPLWLADQEMLAWVDIEGCCIEFLQPKTGERRSIPVGARIGAVVESEDGRLVCALQNGLHYLDPETGQLEFIGDPEQDLEGNRFNDGKCDPAGRFWAGTMPISGSEAAGSLYMLDTDGEIHRKVQDIRCSNGLGWSMDGTEMYYIDTPTQRIDVFHYDSATGKISERRPLVEVPSELGFPDGMTVDAEGKIWLAHWGGSCITRWDPATGQQLDKVELPVSQVTSCAFGGKNLDVLYITSARVGLSEERLKNEPLAGGVFAYVPGVKGRLASRYNGK